MGEMFLATSNSQKAAIEKPFDNKSSDINKIRLDLVMDIYIISRIFVDYL
jgi:hypothetical protein